MTQLRSVTYSGTIRRYVVMSAIASVLFSLILLRLLPGHWFTVLQLTISLIHALVAVIVYRDNYYSASWINWVAWVLMLSLLIGNPFNFISGVLLWYKRVSPIQLYLIFATVADVTAIEITLFNLFKESLSPTFNIGMIVLGISFLIHLILIAASLKLSNWSMKVILAVTLGLIVLGLSGNILSWIAAWLVWRTHASREDAQKPSVFSGISRYEVAMYGLYVITLIAILALTSYLTFEYRYGIENNYYVILQPPSLAYPLGTDNFGRDVFSRMVFGGRISLVVGLLATILPLVIGGFLGAVAGYFGKQLDQGIMRLLDVLYAIPGILLAITIVTAFGSSTENLILALSIGGIPGYARTMRASVLQVSQLEYVEAAKAIGLSDWKILFSQVVPNASAPMIIRSSLTVATAVISTSSLSYLGLGVESHIPEWGNILRVGSTYLETQPYLAIYPGIAIIALVLAFNFLGDGLRDALDPKMN